MKMLSPILMSATLVLVGASQTFAVPVQWLMSAGGNDHWYEAVYADQQVAVTWSQGFSATYSGGIAWTAARDAATAKGGWLADITSPEENAFVYTLIEPTQHSGLWFPEYGWLNRIGPWIGGFQPAGSPEPGGNWQWTNGSSMQYTNWASSPGQQPANSYQGTGDPEDAVHFYDYTGKWNDYPSWAVTNGYVVESVPEPSTLMLLLAAGIGLLGYTWRKRK